jgi:hypothetical protein
VFVVSQRDSGLVVAKSLYRALGTIAGVLFSILLVFTFAQPGELFLTSLALWIVFCTFAAAATRNFASYGLVLAGYTAAIVGVPAALNPNGAYTLVIARFTEIMLGLACAALFSHLIFPRELAPRLVALVRQLIWRAERLAEAATNPARDLGGLAAERARFVTDFATADGIRASAHFESADARIVDGRLGQSIDAALHASAVANELMAGVGSVADGASESPGQVIRDTDDTPSGNGAAVSTLCRARAVRALSQVLSRLREARAALDGGSTIACPRPARRPWSDPVPAALNAARSALAIVITSAFWIATAWPSGAVAVIVAGVICSLFASMEGPVKISLAAIATILLAAYRCSRRFSTFCRWRPTFRRWRQHSRPSCWPPATSSHSSRSGCSRSFTSSMARTSTTSRLMIRSIFSMPRLLGIGIATALFAVFFPETPIRIERRFHCQLIAQLRRTSGAEAPSVQVRESALYERLATTLARLKGESSATRSCFDGAMIALSTARAIDDLRTAMVVDRLPRALAAGVSNLLGRISSAYRYPCRTSLTKCAWEARNLRRRSLAMARAASNAKEIEALAEILAGCEALRSNLLKSLILIPRTSDVR